MIGHSEMMDGFVGEIFLMAMNTIYSESDLCVWFSKVSNSVNYPSLFKGSCLWCCFCLQRLHQVGLANPVLLSLNHQIWLASGLAHWRLLPDSPIPRLETRYYNLAPIHCLCRAKKSEWVSEWMNKIRLTVAQGKRKRWEIRKVWW